MAIPRTLLMTAALTAALPAAALAGTGTNGADDLTLDVGVKPAKAGERVGLTYSQSLVAKDGSRVGDSIKQIKITLPRGFRFDVGAVAQCKESTIEDPNQGPAACPPASVVGRGAATADARPAIPDPLQAQVTAYNGVLDTDVNGMPQPPVPALLVVGEVASLNAKAFLPAEIRGRTLVLETAPPVPGMQSAYTIRDLSLKLRKAGSSKKPYLRSSSTCPKGGWTFAQTVSFFDTAPVTAKDKVACS
jgi:hypothetical protein